jgi:hypothetical protein
MCSTVGCVVTCRQRHDYLDGTRVASPTSQALSGGYQLIEVLTLDAVTADLFGGDRRSPIGRAACAWPK